MTIFPTSNSFDTGWLETLREKESKRYPITISGKYEKVRSVVVDWLIEVKTGWRVPDEVLQHAVYHLDLYQSRHETNKETLQTEAIAAFSLAYKYFEDYSIDLSEYSYLTDFSSSNKDIYTAELAILKEVDWQLGSPTIAHFTPLLFKAIGYPETFATKALSKLSDIVLLDPELASEPPSLLATLLVARVLGKELNSEIMRKLRTVSCYSVEEVSRVQKRLDSVERSHAIDKEPGNKKSRGT